MADRTTFVRIRADITDLQGKLAKGKNDLKSFASEASKNLTKNKAEWASLSTSIGLVGGAMLGVSALAVKGFADFDKSMSKVKASGADAASNIDALRQAAIKAGADTQYSAAEAADAITDLAKAGVTAKDILGGGLSGALALAASGEMDVKDAAETTAVALQQFGLQGNQAGHVADLLAAGAGKAMGEVSDLGQALAQGGLVAHQTGLTIEETVGALSAFASAGMLGSDAGTSLKTMLQRLTPQSAEAKKEFEKLGISAYDSGGRFVGLTNFAGQLHDRMKDLSPQARNAALSVMFGSDAVRAASVLYEQGAGGIQQWIDAVNDQGFAARQAATLTDNLAGDIERLGGSIDTVFIQSGSGANNVLRQMAQGANSVVDAIGQLPEPLLTTMTLLGGAGGVAGLGVSGMLKLASAAADAKDNFKALGISANTAKVAVTATGAALAVGTLALAAWVNQQAQAKADADDFASTLVVIDGKIVTTTATIAEINDKLSETRMLFGFGPALMDLMDQVGVSAKDAQGYLAGNADAIDRVNDAMQAYVRSHPLEGSMPTTMLQQGLDGLRGSLSAAERATLQKAEADKAAGASASTYSEALAQSVTTTDDAANSLKDYATQLFKSANAALKASGTQIGWEAALDDTAKAIKKTGEAHRLANGQLDLNTAKGRQNQQALNQLAQSSVAYAQSLMEQGASEDRVKDAMSRSRDAFVKQAVAAGMSKTAAKKLADAYGLIPSDVSTDISVTGGDKSATKLAIIQAAIADLPSEQKVEVLSAFDKGGVKAANEALAAINGKTVTTYIDVAARVVNKAVHGNQARATGGAIEGPGSGTSDSIPAMLSNGEHVLTASDVSKAGGQGAIYRMRAGIQAGIYRFADGGAVEHYAGGGAAKKRKAQAKADAEARASLLAELQTWVRRGTIPSDVASGSGLSQVDTMLDWADNSALSKAARAKLKSAALSYEKTLGSLTSQLNEAKSTLDTVQGIYDDVYSNLSRAGSSLADLAQSTLTSTDVMRSDANGNIWYETETTGADATAGSITARKSAEAAKLGTLATKLGQLQRLGANTAFLQEIASVAGSDVNEAISIADMYLQDNSQIGLMNSAYDQLTAYSKGAAEFVTDSAYQGGLAAAKGVVDTLGGSLASLGEQLAGSLASALGKVVVGTSVTTKAKPKKKAVGGPVYAGELYQVNEQGIELFRPAVSGVILTASQTQQAIGSGGFSAADLAAAFSRLSLTLLVDGKPVSAIVQASLAAEAGAVRYALPGGGI